MSHRERLLLPLTPLLLEEAGEDLRAGFGADAGDGGGGRGD
jgi:hypothetical protein